MEEQYLRVLDVPPDATEQQIKRAYRRLAKRYHPDRSTDPLDHERFLEVTEAYRFLIFCFSVGSAMVKNGLPITALPLVLPR